ncbi:MAG: hypothetical protein JW943_04815 [Deltaproteobacteria bacterium]|nr:hypothetical protein [Deltaproteobacteria bacterium]
MRTKSEKMRTYQLNIIAKFFACIMTAKWRNMFRFTAVLTETVDPFILNQAVDKTLPRFPFFAVFLRQGFLWPYLQESDGGIIPDDDNDRPFSYAGKPPLFRICYHDRQISGHIMGTPLSY